MSESDDDQNREIVIAAKLEENGVAIRIKSRAASAIERLVSSIVDIPTAFAEGIARKKRINDQIKERLKLVEAEITERKLRGLPNAGDELLQDILKDTARKQINSANVAIEALDALKALPPPEDDKGTGNQDEADKIDPDWMNQFQRYAEDASSEQLQQLWGRVLAGEINRSGSFSRHALRFIAELDKETAENCEYAAERAVDGMIPKTEEWKGGKGYLIGLDLQRLGLIEGVSGLGSSRQYSVGDSGYWVLKNDDRALVTYAAPGTKFSVDAIMLTRLGNEILSLLAPSDRSSPLRVVADRIAKDGVTRIELGRIVTKTATGGRFLTEEVVWADNQPDGEGAENGNG